jgi:glycosyltransferase involved in cell wall biosynthesis
LSARRVLYVQHAGALGGSCMSLLYTLQGIDRRRVRPIVAFSHPHPDVEALYERAEIETLAWPGIEAWNNTTAIQGWAQRRIADARFASTVMSWRRSEERTLALVARVRPDLVHLNSVVLAASARSLARQRIPFVWHVREHPPVGTARVRTAALRRMLRAYPARRIFLSDADRRAWGCDGEVIPNFVDFAKFDRRRSGLPTRERLGIGAGDPVVLYVGGLSRLKGALPLIAAMAKVRERVPRVHCIAPSSKAALEVRGVLRVARAILPKLGTGTIVQQCLRSIDELRLRDRFHLLPFDADMPGLIAACDLLVFPAIAPHFARPVVEAAAMGKPVVASRLRGMDELLMHARTGFLVAPGDIEALADAIALVLSDRAQASAMGETSFQLARERFSVEANIQRIMDLYDTIRG